MAGGAPYICALWLWLKGTTSAQRERASKLAAEREREREREGEREGEREREREREGERERKQGYLGSSVGPEPTTDRFVAIMKVR